MVLGHRLHGDGPEKVILYNDWLADCTSWEPTLPYLDTDSFTYCLTDLRGYGRSMDLKGAYHETEAASDTLELVDHLGWGKFHVVGFSMTGMVVERLAIDAPDRLKCIIAIGPVSAAAIKFTPEEKKFFEDVVIDDSKARELASRITNHRLDQQWEKVKLRLARETRTAEAARGYLEMWTGRDFSAESIAANPKTPILIVGCAWDQPKFLEEDLKNTFLKWHASPELIMMECGHCPMQEMPIYLQTIMERFIRKWS